MKTKAAMYIRTASTIHVSESNSLDEQRLRIYDYAKLSGYKIVADYCDIASGFKGTRAGLNKLMNDAANSRFGFEVVLVYKLSNSSRDIFDQEVKVRILLKRGLRLISIKESLPHPASSSNFSKTN
ncbi:hypothetical protein KUL113_24680 [Tenacibaculum sp. KUL113]|nr:hypothetical protein KUL113_24680 [Tenacibaculum sp. KUL113]